MYALPPRRPPRRTAGGAAVLAIGGLAAMFVIVILTMSAFGGGTGSEPGTTTSQQRTGTVDRAVATANPLYRTGDLTPIGCRLPAITPGSDAAMDRFMNRLSDCLDSVWAQQFGKASGLRFGKPSRTFWTEAGRSPCGSYPQPGAAAFYCPANDTMYVGLRDVITTAGNEPVSNYAVYARVIAHEYAHHVQNRSGILAYGHQQMQGTQAEDARNEISRRIELQAQCLAGAFLGAERSGLPMTRQQYDAMVEDVRGRGDERHGKNKRDHGSSASYAGWVIRGFQRGDLAACNTWTAPESAVD